jgi:uncharacterized protein YndB with AHSA1/START domain
MNAVVSATTLTVKRTIAAPAQQVFDAWLDPAALSEWMRPCSGTTRPSDVKTDAREGGAFEIVMHPASGPVRHTGVYKTIEAPHRLVFSLVFTWNSPHAGENDSLVTVEFRPQGNATEVVITHERLPQEKVSGHTGGWTSILESLSKQFTSGAETSL